jgi:cytochrome P450
MVLAVSVNERHSVSSTTTTLLAVGALVTGASFYYLSQKTKATTTNTTSTANDTKKKTNTVPYASAGILTSIQEIGGRDMPVFLLGLAQEAKEKGCIDGTFRLPVSLGGLYVIGNHKVARAIKQDPLTDKVGQFYNPFNQITGSKASIFSSMASDYHTMVRKSTSLAFSNKEVARMDEISNAAINEWIAETAIPLANTGKSFDPAEEMPVVVMKIICKAAFEYDITEEEHEEFLTCMDKCLREYLFKQATNPLRKPFGLLIEDVRDAQHASKNTQAFAARVLDAYRKNPNKSDANTLIKLIATNDHYPSDEDRIGEIIIYLIAGHDTTGFSLATTFTLLAKNPKVAEKLRAELKKLPADKWATDCEYLKHVIKESMRMFPASAILGSRQPGRDFETDDGRIIPKGASCLFLHAAFGRDERYFENPEEFNPDRWYNPTEDMKVAVMSFSTGNRGCVGRALAMAELNSIIPRIVNEFSLELVKDGTPDYFLTWKLAGVQLGLKKL